MQINQTATLCVCVCVCVCVATWEMLIYYRSHEPIDHIPLGGCVYVCVCVSGPAGNPHQMCVAALCINSVYQQCVWHWIRPVGSSVQRNVTKREKVRMSDIIWASWTADVLFYLTDHCLKPERWQGPPHVNKVNWFESVLSVCLFSGETERVCF